ncbi:hypothetical protein BDZ97DRAFT_1919464 [Flammula alnicola]|nr:hypothetical protein BDZ97DRAFT_1919464 [Flammula alnicola]
MSEDDRAAKAARAKALLKKRQQKKAADSAVASSGVASPVIPSRTFSPAPSEPTVEEDVRDLGDVFSNKDTSDTSWLSSLPRVASPPPPPALSAPTTIRRVSATSTAAVSSNHPPKPPSPNNAGTLQQKLDTLYKENESLKDAVSRLPSFEAAAQQAEALLVAERKRVEELEQNYQRLQNDTETALENEQRTVSLLVTEKAHLTSELQKRENFESEVQELADHLDAERTKSESLNSQVLQLRTEVRSVLSRAERAEGKEKDLAERYKEQASYWIFLISSRQLTGTLTQERQLQLTAASAAELRKEADESQRKLRELEEQIQSDDRVERLENSLKHTQDRADELEFQLAKLKQVFEFSTRRQIGGSSLTITGAYILEIERDGLESKVSETSTKEADLNSKLSDLTSQLADAREKLSQMEKERDAVSQENQGCKTCPNPLKPPSKSTRKNSAKLHRLWQPLENSLGEARDRTEQIEASWKEKLSEQEKRHREIQTGNSDIQKAYAELQEELDTALASLRNLETQRTNQHQEAARRLEEIELLVNQTQTQGDELDTLKQELEARRKAHVGRGTRFPEQAQNEIEALRSELAARDNEIEELRDIVNSPARSDAPRSFDDEMLRSIKQQHAMEISAATSQKQVNALEEQLSQLRPNSRLGHRISPMPSRPASRAVENDLRRSSFGSNRPNQPPPLSRTIFDHSMTPETLHKRKVSLSMLKARIESEVKVTSQPPSRALSPVQSDGHSRTSSVAAAHHVHRPQFLDESHVFWCHSCHGDLVIL